MRHRSNLRLGLSAYLGVAERLCAWGSGAVSKAFFAKISPSGDKIVYAGGLTATMRLCSDGSRCFLSTLATYGASIAVDPAGNAYIAGTTFGRGLPATSGAFLTDRAGAFAAKVNSAGMGMVYVTLLDGPTTNGTVVSAGCTAFAIAADSAGNPP